MGSEMCIRDRFTFLLSASLASISVSCRLLPLSTNSKRSAPAAGSEEKAGRKERAARRLKPIHTTHRPASATARVDSRGAETRREKEADTMSAAAIATPQAIFQLYYQRALLWASERRRSSEGAHETGDK